MRVLVVAEQYPWPARDGYRRRMDHVVRGLARVATVDVVALHRDGTYPPEPPDIAGVANAIPVESGPDATMREWLSVWIRSGVPRRILGPEWSGVRSAIELRIAESGDYDLVWFSHVDTWWPMRDDFSTAAHIVDFDNLENLALRLRRRMPPRFAPGASSGEKIRMRLRWGISRLFDLVDERRWDSLQRECASRVDRVVVCSELDVERSGCPNAIVIGNGADAPRAVVVDRGELRGDRPTLLFVGALDYEPNTEAVEWFVRDVFPLLSEQIPDVSVRIVGRGRSQFDWMRRIEGIDLVGSVDDLDAELGSADISIVPIRVGAGTRLKVVEALANHLPLVTTSIGHEGIEIIDREHAMVADDASAFADACVELICKPELRQRLADNGAKLFTERYDWALIEDRLADTVGAVMAERGR